MKKLIALLALAAMTGCPACPPPDIPGPDKLDGGKGGADPVLPEGVDPATAACERYEELGCKATDGRNLWEDTPGGHTCVEVFKNAEANGIDLHPSCIAKIETCEERHACTDKG